MTSTLLLDFKERSKEVSRYFIFLKTLEQGTTRINVVGSGRKTKIREVDSELLKIMKASGFLLLYNLVESTMRSAIEAIFDEISRKRISFDQVKPELKKIVLQNLKKRSTDKIVKIINSISVDIISAGFDREELFSGNIDARKIQETASSYGFSHSTDYRKTGHGADLVIIKANRNDLAHGIKSFTEVGRNQTADQLLTIKNKVIKYLRQILENVETYILNREYLDSTSGTTSP